MVIGTGQRRRNDAGPAGRPAGGGPGRPGRPPADDPDDAGRADGPGVPAGRAGRPGDRADLATGRDPGPDADLRDVRDAEPAGLSLRAGRSVVVDERHRPELGVVQRLARGWAGPGGLLPAFARRVVQTEAMGYSVLLACGGLGATIGALVVASLGGLRRKERLIPAGMALFGTMLAAAGFLPTALIRAGLDRAALPAAA